MRIRGTWCDNLDIKAVAEFFGWKSNIVESQKGFTDITVTKSQQQELNETKI